MSFHLSDYTLDQTAVDLTPWAWLLPSSASILFVNLFAEAILLYDDGTIHYLDAGGGTARQVAESREHLAALLEDVENQRGWFMSGLVDECRDAGLILEQGQCYGFRTLPTLGGQYDVENVFVTKPTGYWEFSALVHEQIQDLPDGSQVRIVLTP